MKRLAKENKEEVIIICSLFILLIVEGTVDQFKLFQLWGFILVIIAMGLRIVVFKKSKDTPNNVHINTGKEH